MSDRVQGREGGDLLRILGTLACFVVLLIDHRIYEGRVDRV